MAYFTKIGYQQSNQNRTTCKGYQIYRISNIVVIRFGAINVNRTIAKKFQWKGSSLPNERRLKFRSESETKNFVNKRINQKLKEGYTRLWDGVKIY